MDGMVGKSGRKISQILEEGCRRVNAGLKAYPSRRNGLLCGIEGKVQFENVDAGLAQNAKLTAFRILGDQPSEDVLVKPARVCHAAHLIVRGRRTDVGIETAG